MYKTTATAKISFDPGLKVGEVINNDTLHSIFKCKTQGGMRPSKETNTLVLVSNYLDSVYHDKWIDDVFHLTGMGLSGDQDLNYRENKTLNESRTNGVGLHLFIVVETGMYIYFGRVELVDDPYTEKQNGEDGIERTVYVFPIQPVPQNDLHKRIKNISTFIFKDKDEYEEKKEFVEREFAISLRRKKSPVGQIVEHKEFGVGKVTKCRDGYIEVKFVSGKKTSFDYNTCFDKGVLTFV